MKTLGVITSVLLLSLASGVAGQASASEAHRLFEWRPFLAPFHAVVLHFPIGFLTLAGILEIYREFRPSLELRRVTLLVLWLGLLAGIISAAFGLTRAGGGGYELRALELHRLYGLAVPFVTAAALALQWLAHRNEAARGWTHAYRVLLAGTLGLVVVAGHLGGNLTHAWAAKAANLPSSPAIPSAVTSCS